MERSFTNKTNIVFQLIKGLIIKIKLNPILSIYKQLITYY